MCDFLASYAVKISDEHSDLIVLTKLFANNLAWVLISKNDSCNTYGWSGSLIDILN